MSSSKSQAARELLSKISLKAKQVAFNLSDVAVKAKDATNNEPWGPHGQLMSDISEGCYDAEKFKQVWDVLKKRIAAGTGEKWRMAYKSLLVIEFLVKQSSQHVVQVILDNSTAIQDLQKFTYKDEAGKDWGLNVRNRAKELCTLLGNPDRIRAERAKAKANKEKYKGVMSSQPRSEDSVAAATSELTRVSPGAHGASRGMALPSHIHEAPRAEQEDKGEPSEEDAFVATAKRISSLKQAGLTSTGDGRQPSAAPDQPDPAKLGDDMKAFLTELPAHATAKPTLRCLSDTRKAAPKKLGDVRVNPNIAASFSGIKLAYPPADPQPPSPVKATTPTGSPAPTVFARTPHNTELSKACVAAGAASGTGVRAPAALEAAAAVAPLQVQAPTDPFEVLSGARGGGHPLPHTARGGSPTAHKPASGNPFGATVNLHATAAPLPEDMFTTSPLSGLMGFAAGPKQQEGTSKPPGVISPVGPSSSRSPLVPSRASAAASTPPTDDPFASFNPFR